MKNQLIIAVLFLVAGYLFHWVQTAWQNYLRSWRQYQADETTRILGMWGNRFNIRQSPLLEARINDPSLVAVIPMSPMPARGPRTRDSVQEPMAIETQRSETTFTQELEELLNQGAQSVWV